MPRSASLVLVVNQSYSHILLLLRKDVPVWVIPGGGIEEGETARTSGLRELQEETGLHLEEAHLAATYMPTHRFTAMTHIFVATVPNEDAWLNRDITPCPLEARDARFFPLKELPSSLFPIHRIWIEELFPLCADIISGKTPPIQRTLDEITWKWVIGIGLRYPLFVLRYLMTRIFQRG